MMMDCKQLREVLDCYVDGELSPEAIAAAEAHLHSCANCMRAVTQLNALRSRVRRAVCEYTPSARLHQRVQNAIRTQWRIGMLRSMARSRWPVAAAVVLLIGAGVMTASVGSFSAALASTIDRIAIGIDEVHEVDLEGMLLCRDCELEKRHGIRALCPTIGHHGALATPDGRIWSIVDQPASSNLIHNPDLLGTRVRAHGRLFRSASSLAIRTYEALGPADDTPAQVTRAAAIAIP
jgi:hypothetical protein